MLKCRLHSPGDYGDIRGGGGCEEKRRLLTFLFHLSQPFIPYPSLLSQLILLFLYAVYLSPLMLCMLRLVEWTWNALVTFSQRAPISAALESGGSGRVGGVWGHFKNLFLVPLSATPDLLLFWGFFFQSHCPAPSSHPSRCSVFNSVVVGCEVNGKKKGTMRRKTINVGLIVCGWNSPE